MDETNNITCDVCDKPFTNDDPMVELVVHSGCRWDAPADDGEPVTVEWLESVGAETNRGNMICQHLGHLSIQWTIDGKPYRDYWTLYDGYRAWWVCIPWQQTCGAVRQLCRCLGIELTK